MQPLSGSKQQNGAATCGAHDVLQNDRHVKLLTLARPLVHARHLDRARDVGGSSSAAAGLRRQFQVGGVTHVMLGFEFAGGWRDVKGSVAVTVLQFLLGGGGSFSSGGPGVSCPLWPHALALVHMHVQVHVQFGSETR